VARLKSIAMLGCTRWCFLWHGTRRMVSYRADVMRFQPVKANGKRPRAFGASLLIVYRHPR
jgi:hypothetical protein